jgi:hypothetical protein
VRVQHGALLLPAFVGAVFHELGIAERFDELARSKFVVDHLLDQSQCRDKDVVDGGGSKSAA